jgi:hypothetical protein
VIKEAEWQALWQKLSAEERKTLLHLDANEYLLDENNDRLPMETGTNSVEFKPGTSKTNFYRKTTHGLIPNGGVPDTATKYVLAFGLGLHDDKGDAARAVLEKAGYLRQEISVTSGNVKVNGSRVEITLPEELPDGRQFEANVSANAFADAAGNGAEKIDGWHFWSQGIAEPVIRVNRASYKGENPFTTPSQTLPFVDVPVRIDCETPGAVITYGILVNGKRNETGDWIATGTSGTVSITSIANATASELTGIDAKTPYTLNSTFYAGDGGGVGANGFYQVSSETDSALKKARKDYNKAKSSRVAGSVTLEAEGYEGVFKTVMMMMNNGTSSGTQDISRFRIDGSDGAAKVIISGFPFHGMPENSDDYGLDAYRILNTSTSCYHFLWLSWEIVSPWYQSARCYKPSDASKGNSSGNNQNPTSAKAGYGDLMFNPDTKRWP